MPQLILYSWRWVAIPEDDLGISSHAGGLDVEDLLVEFTDDPKRSVDKKKHN